VWHFDFPGPVVYPPLEHFRQYETPLCAEYFPVPHNLQTLAPCSEKLPARQSSHVLVPSTLWKDPAWHNSQVAYEFPSSAALPRASVYDPALHFSHCALPKPSACVPLLHARQKLAADPASGIALPGAQSSQ
jgi:hypothetical protein